MKHTSSDAYPHDRTVTWTTRDSIYVTGECVLGLLTIVSNGLVLVAMRYYPRLRTVTNCYIGSLAVADILAGLGAVPLVVVAHVGLPHNFYACVLVNCLVACFFAISILSLVCVNVDRYMAIRHPLFHLRVSTTQRALLVVAVLWIVGIAFGFTPFVVWRADPEDFSECSYRRVIDLKYTVYIQFLGFLVPILLLMLALYARILLVFRTSYKNRITPKITRKIDLLKVLKRPSAKEMKLLKRLALIFVLLTLCVVPIFTVNCIRLWSPATQIKLELVLFTLLLVKFNSFINPILYAASQPGFRDVMARHFPSWLTRLMGLDATTVSSRSLADHRKKTALSLVGPGADNPQLSVTRVVVSPRVVMMMHLSSVFDLEAEANTISMSDGSWIVPAALYEHASNLASAEEMFTVFTAEAVSSSHG